MKRNSSVGVVVFLLLAITTLSWADITIHITPPEAVTAGAQWRVDEGAWQSSDATVAAIDSGWHQIEFRQIPAWTEPSTLSLFNVAGSPASQTALYKAIPRFTIGEIPPQSVWHGKSLRFFVQSVTGGSVTCSTGQPPLGAISFDPGSGLFVYTPNANDRFPFTTNFISTSGGQPLEEAVRITPMPNLPPEQTVFGADSVMPPPPDETELTIESRGNPEEYFNHGNRSTQDIRITGEIVVFQTEHPNHLYTNYNGAANIKNLEINAKRVVIQSPLRLPQTNVTIYAERLEFEAEGSITTTPLSHPLPRPAGPNGGQGLNGVHGLKAGDMNLVIRSLSAPPGGRPLDLRGGRGQDPGLGRDGNQEVVTMPSVTTWYGANFNNLPIVYGHYHDDDIFSGDDYDYFGTQAWPPDGENAVAAGIPGSGGAGGNLTSTLALASYAVYSGGEAGVCADPNKDGGACEYEGGPRGQPEVSIMVGVERSFDYSTYMFVDPIDGWNIQIPDDDGSGTILAHRSYDGTDAAEPPRGAQGSAGVISDPSGDPLQWLYPINLKSLLDRVKDLYLDGYLSEAQRSLEEYTAQVDAYKERTAWTHLTAAERLEMQQMNDEMQILLHRIRSNLDYFGNPAGWVPMLSFEVNRTVFDNEIDRAIEVLYLSYWLRERAVTIQDKVDALSKAREKVKAEIEDAKTRFQTAVELIPSLQIEAGRISAQVYNTQLELTQLEHVLQEQAEENLEEPWWKTGLKIAGKICSVIPVGQPVLGAIGGGMDLVANFNPNDPWSSITGAADIAGTFASSNFDNASKELKKKIDQVETRAAAEQRALENAEGLKDWTGAVSGGLKGIKDILGKTQAPQSAVEAELQKLKAQSREFKEMSGKLSDLMNRKMEFSQQLAAAMQDVASLSNLVTTDLLALDGMNRDISAGDNVLDDRALMYLNEMERRAKERLLKYHYFMAKAYEYRMLRRYEGNLNLDDLMEEFIAIGEENIGGDEPYVLTAEQFHSLKAIYEEQLSTVAQGIFEEYNSNPPELSAPVRFNLTQDELDKLNSGKPVSLNLMDIGLFLPSEENVRIVDFEVVKIESHLEGGEFSRWANLNLYIEHSGISSIESGGKILKFNHYNSATTNPIVWGTRYDWYDNIADPIKPSAASDSLLRSLLQSDMAQDMQLYSRPSAWANLNFRKEVNSDNGTDVVIDSLRLKLTYDFMRKVSQRSTLEVLVSQDGSTPYFTVDTRDINNRQDGRGAFRRIYPMGQTVTVQAQPRYGRWRFQKWTDRHGYDITGQDPTDPTRLSVFLYDDNVVMAQYVSADEELITLSGDVKTSGGTGVEGVTISFGNGQGSTTTDALGHYSKPLPFGWFGTVTPSKEGFSFNPSGRTYIPIVASRENQNFTLIPTGTTSLAASKQEIDFGDTNTSDTFLVWNKGTGTMGYTITVIEGSTWFSVTPSSGSSSGLSDKQPHTVTVDHTEIPAGETRTGTIEIASYDGQILYVSVAARNNSVFSIMKCTFTPGPGRNRDSFSIYGYLNATADQIRNAASISFRLSSADRLIYGENLPFDSRKFRGGVYHYNREVTAEHGAVTEFRVDVNQHRFRIRGREVNLSGLDAPIVVDLIIGDFAGSAEAEESIINKGKPLSLEFMSGMADLLRVDRAAVVSKQGFDRLSLEGRIALRDNSIDLETMPIYLIWGSQSFTLPPETSRRRKGDVYTTRSTSDDGTIIAQFDLEKCTFKITIRAETITPKSGRVIFGIALGTFNQMDEFDLP